jgi:MFS family permease
MAGFTVVILVPRWEAVIGASTLFLCWSAVSLPATMGLVAEALPKAKRTMGVSMHSLVRRFPMALGPVVGGLCLDYWGVADGVRIGFIGALAMAGVAVVVQQLLIEETPRNASAAGRVGPVRLFREMNPGLRNLLVSDILIRFCEQIPNAFVVIWCMRQIASPVSGAEFGVLTAVEMATAVLCYIPVAYLADRTAKKPFVLMTFVFFTAFPVVLLYCQTFGLLVFAFILRGLKEFGEPTRKALIMDLAAEDKKAQTFGLYYLIRDTVVSIAAFAGAGLWDISPAVNLLSAFGFGVIGTIWFGWMGSDPNFGPREQK